MTDETLKGSGVVTDVAAAVQAVLASTDGRYGYPGPTTKCGVSLTATAGSAGNSAVLAKASAGTAQGRDTGWTLDMAGGGDPVAAGSSSSSSGGSTGGTTTTDTGTGTSGTGTGNTSDTGTTTSGSAWSRLAEGLGTTEAALKALVGVPTSRENVTNWGEISRLTGKSVQELKALAGVNN